MSGLQTPLIILAAGMGARLGVPKALFSWNGRPWIDHQIESFRRIGGKNVLIVLPKIMPIKTHSSYDSVVNPHPDTGPFGSLLLGVARISGPVFVLPVDCPVPSASVWHGMESSNNSAIDAIVPSFEGKSGHPIWISGGFSERLQNIPLNTPEARLDFQLQLLKQTRIDLNVQDPGVLLNLNTIDDWKQYVPS